MGAKYSNPGIVNVKLVTESTLANNGGIHERGNRDGSTHVSVYSRNENRHISYDRDKQGNISNVHTDRNGHANVQYKGGR